MPFSETVRRELSIETGGFCANPACRVMTGMLLPGHTRATGEGAHIVAENPLGPRGQSPLTQEERNMANNGVWLCPTCHSKVDIVRPQDFSIQLLQQWKADAQSWWQQNQGRQLQVAAWPDRRPTVARPSADSLRGARMFLQAHKPLADQLWSLRQQLPALFEDDITVPDSVEQEIRRMSSRAVVGRSWKDEWTTTFHCEDRELLDYMKELIHCTDNLQHLLPSFVNRPRRVNFKSPDRLAQAIFNYLNVWNNFSKCLQTHQSWGI